MSLRIGSVSAKVTVLDGELPLTERQLAQIAEHVIQLLASRERSAKLTRGATEIRRSSQPTSFVVQR
jgi:hypothetical protein